jgi:hypothetical protein
LAFEALCTDGLTVKSNGIDGEASPIRCKRWSCETCAKLNRARVVAIAMAAKPRAMLTLTVSSEHYETPDEAALALKRGLRLLRLRLSRHEKLENFEFLAVFEEHESGYPHLHLLIRGKFIPWNKLRDWWEEITGSTHVHIRKIDSVGKAAFYAAKYIGKALHAFANCKRWWRSHAYSAHVADTYVPDWSLGKPTRWSANIHRLKLILAYEGWTYEKHGREGIRWRRPEDSEFGYADLIAFAEGRTSPSLLRREGRGR